MEKLLNTIECPNCHTVIELDDENYSRIVAQVRTEQFDKEVMAQVNAVKEQQEEKQQSMLANVETQYKLDLAAKDQEIARLQEQAKSVADAQKKELESLQDKAEILRQQELAEKDRQIQALEAKAENAENEKQLAVTKAVQGVEKENSELRIQIEQERRSAADKAHTVELAHKHEVEQLNGLIDFYKDMKIRQSTKMLGETLEQHCMTVYRQHRDEFPYATFEKDNEVVEGTKGDFVFRETLLEGVEFLSIMFEMKNEADDTVKKHKNEDFLAKLDKDRQKKNCEYAVLVSTLEPDDEVYNEGIVAADKYDKMFIVRPQFFLTMIRVLHKAALANVETRKALVQIQRENLDVQKFDEALVEFKDKFGWNCDQAQKHFKKTLGEINVVIDHLIKVRDELEATGKQLGQANSKLQDLSIKKLTKGNYGMQQKFLDAGIQID